MSISFNNLRDNQHLYESELAVNKILIDLFKHPMFDYSQSICKLNFDKSLLQDTHPDAEKYIQEKGWKQSDVILFGYNFGEPKDYLKTFETENMADIPPDLQGDARKKFLLKAIHDKNVEQLERETEHGHLEDYLQSQRDMLAKGMKIGVSWFDKWQSIFKHCTGVDFVIPKPRKIPLLNLVTWSSYDAGDLKNKFTAYYRDLINHELKNQIGHTEKLRRIDLQAIAKERGIEYYLAKTPDGEVKIRHGGEQIIEVGITPKEITAKAKELAEEALDLSHQFGIRVNKAFMRTVKPKVIFWCIRPTDFEDDSPGGPKDIIKKGFGLTLKKQQLFDLKSPKGKIHKGAGGKLLQGAKSHEVYTDNKNRLWICLRHLSAPGVYAFQNMEKEMVADSFKKYVKKMGLKNSK